MTSESLNYSFSPDIHSNFRYLKSTKNENLELGLKKSELARLYDFGWAGHCNMMNIKVLMLFLPRGVHSECEVLPLYCFWWIGISLALSQLTVQLSRRRINIHARKVKVSTGLEGAGTLDLQITS